MLVAGGVTGSGVTNSVDLYNPGTELWTTNTGWLNIAREQHTATLLPDGLLLVAGGENAGTYLASAELLLSERRGVDESLVR